jgi:hypothetical protein
MSPLVGRHCAGLTLRFITRLTAPRDGPPTSDHGWRTGQRSASPPARAGVLQRRWHRCSVSPWPTFEASLDEGQSRRHAVPAPRQLSPRQIPPSRGCSRKGMELALFAGGSGRALAEPTARQRERNSSGDIRDSDCHAYALQSRPTDRERGTRRGARAGSLRTAAAPRVRYRSGSGTGPCTVPTPP